MEMYSLHEGEGLFNKIEVSLDFLFTTLLIGGRDFREGLCPQNDSRVGRRGN